jgi:hypothetical protein
MITTFAILFLTMGVISIVWPKSANWFALSPSSAQGDIPIGARRAFGPFFLLLGAIFLILATR